MDERYGGTYRGVVVDDADPLGEQRLRVRVPELWADDDFWARPSLTGAATPAVGDDVWVSFEHGDTQYPVWSAEGADDRGPQRGFIGKYQARVISNDDPMQERRLQVAIPEVLGEEYLWATPSGDVSDVDLPEIDTSVWVEFEQGDPMYPRWVGVA